MLRPLYFANKNKTAYQIKRERERERTGRTGKNVCNRSHRSKIFHDSGAQNGRGLIEFGGISIGF